MCNALFATIRQESIKNIPMTSFAITQAAQVNKRCRELASSVKAPVVATIIWLMYTLYHRPRATPQATATKAIASSKQGQSSIGSGWIDTRARHSGTMRVGAKFEI